MPKHEAMAKMWISRSLSALQAKYYALSTREQIVVVIGSIAVAMFLLIEVVFFPTYDRLYRLKSSVKNKEKGLVEMKTIAANYKRLESQRSESGRTGMETFSLFSVLEKFATESGLMEKIEYMRPGNIQLDPTREEKWVEIKLARVTLKEFADYLARIQSFDRGVYIKRLSARKDGEYISLILQPAVTETR